MKQPPRLKMKRYIVFVANIDEQVGENGYQFDTFEEARKCAALAMAIADHCGDDETVTIVER